jgi:hypothetical protein
VRLLNTEPEKQRATAEELLRFTGLDYCVAFEGDKYRTCLLKTPGSSEFRSADFLIRSGTKGENPFYQFNSALKSGHLPNTRLETFVFETMDIEKHVSIQKSQGAKFLIDKIVRQDDYSFIQTEPSRFTGNSLGFIQWTGERGHYATSGSRSLDWNLNKPIIVTSIK